MSSSACGSMTDNKIQTQQESMLMMQQQNKKRGIVTILVDTNTNTNIPPSPSSLRRALSADMSSKKWLSHDQNMMMKKIPSSEQLLHSSSTKSTIADSLSSSSSSSEAEAEADAEAERERLEIWSSIQRNKKEEQEKAFDMWSSLVSLKDNNNEISKSLPVGPYVHPLVKRSKSCLSDKSLEICTESLGSETGSDHALFPSSYPPSETEEEQQQQEEAETEEEEEEPRYNHAEVAATTKKTPPRSFPPPLPSLSTRPTSGPSLHMRSRRDNGRLVLEAVSVPSHNNFCVQRQDGRLVLTLADQEETKEDTIGDEEEVAENDIDGLLEEEFEEDFGAGFEEEEHDEEEYIGDEDEAGDDVESVIEKAPLKKLCSEIKISTTTTNTNSVGSLALMMNKPTGLVNRNPKWSEKFNEVETGPLAQSLPPRVPRLIPSTASTAAAASFNFNAYEYFWRTEPTSKDATLPHSLNNTCSTLNNNSTSKLIVSGDLKHVSNDRQQLLVLRGKNGDYMVHNLESCCKDSRKSFLFWEPYCIAT